MEKSRSSSICRIQAWRIWCVKYLASSKTILSAALFGGGLPDVTKDAGNDLIPLFTNIKEIQMFIFPDFSHKIADSYNVSCRLNSVLYFGSYRLISFNL